MPPETSKKDSTTQSDEERLGHALISRGLLTRQELQQCRAGADDAIGPEALLNRLVKGGFLTLPQAKRAAQEMTQLLNQQIPGYQLLEKLGQGAMGIVYKARQLSMDRLVAIKVLHPRLAANKDFIARFQREAHLAAKFTSNNAVQAIDVGSAGPLQYFVMEYVEGTTIRSEIDQGKIYSEQEALTFVLQIAQALRQAHRRKLIHRDIKPANIMVTAEGVAKLADLGMARETTDLEAAKSEKGFAMGTPYYMAPEQVRGSEDVDSRADIYSLGATLYHMVTGQPPFTGKVQAVLRAHLEQEPTPPEELNSSLSAGLGEALACMMAKDRRHRYASPDDLIFDLECLLREEPPKLAQQRLSVNTLADLADGEAEEEEDEDEEEEEDNEIEEDFLQQKVSVVWLCLVAVVLVVSLLLNLVLFLR